MKTYNCDTPPEKRPLVQRIDTKETDETEEVVKLVLDRCASNCPSVLSSYSTAGCKPLTFVILYLMSLVKNNPLPLHPEQSRERLIETGRRLR